MDLKIKVKPDSDQAYRNDNIPVRFELLFQAFPAPTYIWHHLKGDFLLLDYNSAGGAYLSAKKQRYSHHGISITALEDKLVLEDIQTCYQERSNFTRERLSHRLWGAGQVKDLFFNYAFVQPDLVLMSFNDMTQANSTLGMLRRLSSAVEQTADAVFITDHTGVIEYVNPAFEQLTGYSRDEALGSTPRILKSGEMAQGYYQQLWKKILAGEPFQAQTVNRRKDGTKFVVEQTITPLKDQSGHITHFVSLLKDMTERIRFQEQEAEHRLAGSVQRGLFPKEAPVLAGYDIAGAVFPANNTSGDCFDFISMPENTMGIVVGDVCGHGMGSALIMAEARAYLRSITRFVSDPQVVLSELHTLIQEDLVQTGFITMFLARLDFQNHLIRYANAGNWPAYIIDPEGNISGELIADGYPIGISQVLQLKTNGPVRLDPGSMVIFITDGIPEARDELGKQFGINRLLAVIKEHRGSSAREIIQMVRNEVLSYMGANEQTDDQTLVICKRERPQ